MRRTVFLFRTKSTADKFCCAYIDIGDLKTMRICCDGKFNIRGANFSMSLNGEFDYSEIETILTENQYNRLINPDKNDCMDDIVRALTSSEAEELFEQIVDDEKEIVKDGYGLSSDEVDKIFNEYSLPYQDHSIVWRIWNSIEELGREYIEGCYNVPKCLDNYIDYESFGESLLDNCERYVDLGNGYVAEYVY